VVRIRRALPLLLSVVSACAGGSGDAPVPRFWSQRSLHDEYLRGRTSPDACRTTNPGSLPCNYFVDAGRVANDGVQRDVLQIKLTFTEHGPSAYITTDFWENWNEIWVEPMYVLVWRWNAADPEQNRLPSSPNNPKVPAGPIFTVGPDSAFYSPYHQVTYVEVPPGTDPSLYTSARQILDAGFPLHAGPRRFCSLDSTPLTELDVFAPNEAEIRANADKDEIDVNRRNIIEPYLKPGFTLSDVVSATQRLTGWLDGRPITYLDFGPDGFTADGDSVVQDIPLFLFVKPDDAGTLQPIDEPNVGGVAPLFSGQAPQVAPDHRPHFGALWRIYYVVLPARADGLSDISKLTDNVPADRKAQFPTYQHRVALNADECFNSVTFPDGPTTAGGVCRWLDSQAAVEALGPSAIIRTELEPACPFVMWRGFPVLNPQTVLP